MIIIKDRIALQKMRQAGLLLSQVMKVSASKVLVGASTLEIDMFIESEMRKRDLNPVCKGYCGYAYASCISLNDVVVHGVPSDKVVLKSGDFVKIDIAASYQGYCADMARYFFVGEVDKKVDRLAKTAKRALDTAIDMIAPGVSISEISSGIQKVVEDAGFGVVRVFAGHGLGKSLHEDPEVPNFEEPGHGPILREGMTIAIEPMITQGSYDVKIDSDGWTARTVDGGMAAHIEDTIAVTKSGAEVLTRPN